MCGAWCWLWWQSTLETAVSGNATKLVSVFDREAVVTSVWAASRLVVVLCTTSVCGCAVLGCDQTSLGTDSGRMGTRLVCMQVWSMCNNVTPWEEQGWHGGARAIMC